MAGVTVDVVAGTSANPVMAGYTAGELIHQYTNIGSSFFTSTDGLGTTLASPGRQRPDLQRGARHRRPAAATSTSPPTA